MLLSKQCQKEHASNLKAKIKNIKSIKSFNDILESWYYKQFLTDTDLKNIKENKITLKELKNKMLLKADKENLKALKKDLKIIENTLSHDKITWGRIEAEWVKSATWGACPRGYYKNGHFYNEYKSIGGCGYDKLSTLSARILNNDIYFKSYLFNYCQNKNINKNNIESKIGYGIRMHNGMPYIEGAVGISCHINILKKIGFNVKYFELKKADLLEFTLNK